MPTEIRRLDRLRAHRGLLPDFFDVAKADDAAIAFLHELGVAAHDGLLAIVGKIRSRLAVICEHLLNWQFQPDTLSGSWRGSI